MNLFNRSGEQVQVVFEKTYAKVGDVVVVAIRDNKVKVWNDLLLDQNSINTVKTELSKQLKVVESSKKRK